MENAPAQYGRTSGGVIDATTRAGSDQFHGSLHEFLRNSVFDARKFFDGSSVPPFKRNQFGATLGGPLKRRQTVFFFDYESVRQSLGVTAVSIVPSPQARQGHLVTSAVRVDPLVVLRSDYHIYVIGPFFKCRLRSSLRDANGRQQKASVNLPLWDRL
jgi:hypothetical protein